MQSERYEQKGRLFKVATVTLLTVALLSGGIFLFSTLRKDPWPSPDLAKAQKMIDYPLYYPSKLPKGFSYSQAPIKPSDTATIYSLTYDKDKKLFISNQPVPKDVVFKDFYDRLLKNKADITSSQGKAVTGQVADQPVGSLVTDKTWVLMNAPSGIGGQELTELISSLKKL